MATVKSSNQYDGSGQKISIMNFQDFSVGEGCHINSPRSLEAMKRNGIREYELTEKPLEEFEDTYKEPKDAIKLRAERYEIIRRRLVRKVTGERKKLISENSFNQESKAVKFRNLDELKKDFMRELKSQEGEFIHRVTRRKQKELHQHILYEIRFHARFEEDMKRMREKVAQQEEADRKAAKAKKDAEQALRTYRHHKEQEEERAYRKSVKGSQSTEYLMRKQLSAEKEMNKIKKRKEAEKREGLRVKLLMEHTMKTEAIFKMQDKLFEAKGQEMMRNSQIRDKRMSKMKKLAAKEKEKQQAALAKKTADIAVSRSTIADAKVDATKAKADERDLKIEHNRKAIAKAHSKKKKVADAHRSKILKRSYKILDSNRKGILAAAAVKDTKSDQAQKKNQHSLMMRRLAKDLKEKEIKEFLYRKKLADNYKKEKAIALIKFNESRYYMKEEMNQKAMELKTQQVFALAKKKQVIHDIVEGMMSKQELTMENLGGELESMDPKKVYKNKHRPVSVDAVKYRKEAIFPDIPAQRNRKRPNTEPSEDPAAALANLQALQDQSKFKGTIKASSPRSSNGKPIPLQTNKTKQKIPDSKFVDNIASIFESKEMVDKRYEKMTIEEKLQFIERLRKEQNEYLLRIVGEEQVREEQREAELSKIQDTSSRLKLETAKFAGERALASERIIKITEENASELEKKMKQLGLDPSLVKK